MLFPLKRAAMLETSGDLIGGARAGCFSVGDLLEVIVHKCWEVRVN